MKVFIAIVFTKAVSLVASTEPSLDAKCVDQKCPSEFSDCTKDGHCMETVGCIVICLKEWDKDKTDQKFAIQNCTNRCTFTFGNDIFAKTLACIDREKCLQLPAIPNTCKAPNGLKIQKNISIAELAGVKWRLRGYNPVYDCYHCQKVNFTTNSVHAWFEALLIGGDHKVIEETGSLVNNYPEPGFTVTINARSGIMYTITYFAFDSVVDNGNTHYLFYYCGTANTWNYNGAFVLTTVDTISDDAEAAVGSSFMNNVKLDFNKFCSIITMNCPQ